MITETIAVDSRTGRPWKPANSIEWDHKLQLWGEGVFLWEEWFNTSYYTDQLISGVFADWVDENIADCKAKPLLMGYLRNKFNGIPSERLEISVKELT